MQKDNIGKCGHAKCAGGTGEHCYERGAPMSKYDMSDAGLGARFLASEEAKDIPKENKKIYRKAWQLATCKYCGKDHLAHTMHGETCAECYIAPGDIPY